MGPTDSLNAVRKWNSISSTKEPKSNWMFSGAFSIFSSSGTSPVLFHPFQDKPREKLSYVVSRLVITLMALSGSCQISFLFNK